MKDAKERFSETAENYDRYRPSYPSTLIDWVLEPFGAARIAIADIGCGTGISSRLFAKRGMNVFGVDPNEAMLAFARAHGGAEYTLGDSTRTGLADRSVDLVIAAQAFHWFAIDPTLDELARILRPNGWCAAFWNTRAQSPFLDAYERLLLDHSASYERISKGPETVAELEANGRLRSIRKADFANNQLLDRDAYRGRVYSSSYVVHEVADKERFDREMMRVFDEHQQGGFVDFVYRTVAIMWQL
jgi:ubiquinone/menaquinone biosynthesis C-methylase UbiE